MMVFFLYLKNKYVLKIYIWGTCSPLFLKPKQEGGEKERK